jgi:hypothetical protein
MTVEYAAEEESAAGRGVAVSLERRSRYATIGMKPGFFASRSAVSRGAAVTQRTLVLCDA